MGLGDIKYKILLNIKNIPAVSVKRKIVVIESDDYGGIRMPSQHVWQKLTAAGYGNMHSRYNLYDSMEDRDDLELLFDVLSGVKDVNNKPAVVSPFVNVANPDFEKIKAAGYQQYFYEPFTTTLKRYGRHSGTMDVWAQGMNEGVFVPEYHGREHISVQPWLHHLQSGNKKLLDAFDLGFVSVAGIDGVDGYAQEFRPEFYFTEQSHEKFLHQSITEGVALFEKLFGYTPTAFMPSNSVFHPVFEETVYRSGIPFLVVAHKNLCPGENGALTFRNFTFRQKIKKGRLNFYIRNCAFEPNDETYSSIDGTLLQMAAAFRWGKPAIISTHRVNFAGAIDKTNRDKGLKELKKLLKAIVARWPDAEFMSSRDLLRIIKNGN